MNNQKKSGVILSYMSQLVQILTNLIYVPIMLRILGQSEYGLYQIAAAVVSNLNILSMGFSSSYIRFFSRYKNDEDEEGISRLNGMFMIIFLVIAAVCVCCGVFLVLNARIILGNQLSEDELKRTKILMLILVLSMAVTFITSVFQSQISAAEKFMWLKGVDLISYVINPIVTLPMLLLGYGSVGVVCVTLVVACFTCGLDFWFVKNKLKAKYIFNNFNFLLFKEMTHFTFYIFVNIVVEQINWSIDKFLLGRMKGTESVAVYSVGSQIITLYRSISGTIRGVFIPQINDMIARKLPLTEVNDLFIRLGRVIYLVAYLICSGFVIFGKDFISYWAGEGYGNSYWVAIIPMVVLMIPIVQGPGIDIQRAMNKHKARSIAYTFIAIGNLFISIFLIGLYGEIGATMGTALSLLLGQGFFMNYYYHKHIGLDMIVFWKRICAYIPCSIICVIVGELIRKLVYHTGIIQLFISIVIYSCVYCLLFYFIGMTKAERKYYSNILNKVKNIIIKKY